MGPDRSPPTRDGSRSAGGGRTAGGGGVATQACGYSIATQPGDRHAASRTSPTARTARTRWCEPHRNETGGAGASMRGSAVQLCVDLPYSTATQDDVVRNLELRSVTQRGMIEGLTVNRQYSPQGKFLFITRIFRARGKRQTPLTQLPSPARILGLASLTANFPSTGRNRLWTDRRQALTRGPRIPSLWRQRFGEITESFDAASAPSTAAPRFIGVTSPRPKEAF